MIRKPTQYCNASLENGLLNISATRESLIYFTKIVTVICLFNLAILAAYGFVSGPLAKFGWWLILFLGTVGTVCGGIFLYLLWRAPGWRFDRARDQFFRGRTIIGRLQDIRQISLFPEQGEDGKLRQVLSVVLEGTAPCCLYKQEQPEELRALANTIANYVGVPVAVHPANEAPTNLMSLVNAPRWLQLLPIALVVIGPSLLLIRQGLASRAEQFLYITVIFPLGVTFFTFLYIRGKRLASQESDAHLRERLLNGLTRFRLLLMIIIAASLASVAITAWLLFVQLPQNQ